MTIPDPPTTPAPVARSGGWQRLRGRRLVIGAAVLAALVVAGVAAVLLLPDRDRGGRGPLRDDPGIERAGGAGPLEEFDGPRRDGPGRDRDRPGDRFGDVPLLVGTVVSAGGDTLVVSPDGASAPRTLRTDDDTRIGGPRDATPGDLAAGDRVVVRVEGTGDAATATAVREVRARVTGTVTALSGNSATLVSVEGLSLTADVTAVEPKPAIGDVVDITGTATGGAITAEAVRVLPKAS